MTISVIQPIEVGSLLGMFDIPLIPCSGNLRVVAIHGNRLELKAERLQGDCEEADFTSLEILEDGTLQYIAKGKNWESRGILHPAG